MRDPLLQAVDNNARWCDMVVRATGGETAWTPDHWTTSRRSPDGYPDAVTLLPGVEVAAVLAGVEGGAGCSVKDSFADLDLAPLGFEVLFEASWIWRSAGAAGTTTALEWQEVESAADLAAWAEGRDVDVFIPALLDEPGLHFFRAPRTGAGFALYRTDTVVGISNAIPGASSPSVLWSDLDTIARRTCPGLDLLGYERGTDLEVAVSAGFTTTGPLRVWMAT